MRAMQLATLAVVELCRWVTPSAWLLNLFQRLMTTQRRQDVLLLLRDLGTQRANEVDIPSMLLCSIGGVLLGLLLKVLTWKSMVSLDPAVCVFLGAYQLA